MSKTILQGRIKHQCRSLYHLYSVAAEVLWRRAMGRALVPEWSIQFEIGNLFFRRQFNHALALPDINEGRAFMDSVYTVLDPVAEVEVTPSHSDEPRGHWFTPPHARPGVTLLYLHGGGYTFYLAVTRHFIALLAQTLGVRIFAPDYRLTPEHAHPAQIEDALAAYRFLLAHGQDAKHLIVGGDSAGGHLTLMLLCQLAAHGLPQPALGLALSPWTDIADRGASLFGNDHYDMVQGYMTRGFARWLKRGTVLPDRSLSPIAQDFRQTAPLYVQAGGREILVDMIRDFAHVVAKQGARVRLDVWPQMTHEFHAYGRHEADSWDALQALSAAIDWALAGAAHAGFARLAATEVDQLLPHSPRPLDCPKVVCLN